MNTYPETDAALIADFKGWLETQDPNGSYDYYDDEDCCFAQYLKDRGYSENPSVGGWDWYDEYGRHSLPDAIDDSLVGDNSRTFGGVLFLLKQKAA